MRTNTLKQKLRDGKPVFGVMISFPSPPVVEMLGYMGFDWVLIDNEHGSVTVDTSEDMIRADYFGRRSIGTIMGLSATITVFGQIGGPLVAGVFADWTGNYRAGFTLLAVLAGLGSLFFLLAKPPK